MSFSIVEQHKVLTFAFLSISLLPSSLSLLFIVHALLIPVPTFPFSSSFPSFTFSSTSSSFAPFQPFSTLGILPSLILLLFLLLLALQLSFFAFLRRLLGGVHVLCVVLSSTSGLCIMLSYPVSGLATLGSFVIADDG